MVRGMSKKKKPSHVIGPTGKVKLLGLASEIVAISVLGGIGGRSSVEGGGDLEGGGELRQESRRGAQAPANQSMGEKGVRGRENGMEWDADDVA